MEDTRTLLASARRKMMASRNKRSTPFIDRTLYTGWNAMAITAYLEAARVLRNDLARSFALLTLRRLLAEAWSGADLLSHVIAYPEHEGGGVCLEELPGNLDDYAFTVHACVDGWLASGRMEFYRAARILADAMIARFYDAPESAFFDTGAARPGTTPLGALTARRKPLQDSPTPAGNPTAASALLRLEALSGSKDYRKIATDTLASFAGIVEHFGLYAGSYGLALERLLFEPIQVIVVGSGPEAARLEAIAVARYGVNKTVMRIAPFRITPEGVPEVIAEMLLDIPAPGGAEVWAIVCRGHICMPPVTTAEGLIAALEKA